MEDALEDRRVNNQKLAKERETNSKVEHSIGEDANLEDRLCRGAAGEGVEHVEEDETSKCLFSLAERRYKLAYHSSVSPIDFF